MNFIKGFRFHPTDQELIDYLHMKTYERDSSVIPHLQDVCGSDPWELPERLTLQTRDRLWYFTYPPKYKYRNSKLISRTTPQGFWKPTGNARKIIDLDTGEEIGSKKTLVFYKGQCNDKNKEKTGWVMHEYELKATPEVTDSNQRTFRLCKLKKKADISSREAGQSNPRSLSNLEHHAANNAILSEDLQNPDESSEPEASNYYDAAHNHCSSVETYAGEGNNQHDNRAVNKDEDSYNLSSNLINHVAENAIPKEPLRPKEVSTEQNGAIDNLMAQNLYSTIEQDDESCNSIVANNDETFSIERSNQQNKVAADGGFKVSSSLDHLADDEDLIPTLIGEPEATANNSNWIQNQYTTSTEGGEFLNPCSADNNEANTQQFSAADNESFSLLCVDVMMESSSSKEKSRKRPRLQHDGLNYHVETGQPQYRMVIPQIGGSITNQ